MPYQRSGAPGTVPNTQIQTYGGSQGQEQYGAGSTPPYPGAYAGFYSKWSTPALSTLGPMAEFMGDTSKIADYFSGEMKGDIGKYLFEQAKTQIGGANQAAKREGSSALSRAGYGGAASTGSGAYMSTLRHFAAAGQLGSAAQSAELAARQYKGAQALNLYNVLSGRFQAGITPGQIQISGRAKVPVSGGGPSALQNALDFTNSLLSS